MKTRKQEWQNAWEKTEQAISNSSWAWSWQWKQIKQYQPCVIANHREGFQEIQGENGAIKKVETWFSSLPRTPQTAVRRGSWCVTSIRVAVMAASSTMSSIASWLLMALSARSSWNHTTGATPPEAGRPFFCPSATPAWTALGPPPDTGQVGRRTTPSCALF